MITNYPKRYPLSIFVACIITVISLIPFPEIKLAEEVPLADKWVHMAMYGSLCLCIWGEYLHKHQKADKIRLALFAVISPILMGGTIELMQAYLTTTRSGDCLDFAANSIGVGIVAVIGYTTVLVRKR